jgi:peroxiredoxin family protein
MQNEDIMTGDMLVEIVENQLTDGNPVKVKETLMRLVMSGTPREEAVQMIACALSIEVFDVAKNEGTFDLKRYSENLTSLPDMPWEFED